MSIPSPGDVPLDELAAALDAAAPGDRVGWVWSLPAPAQRELWEACAGRAVEPSHFHGGPGEVIAHAGRNSLPVFRRFEKRFCLHEGRVQGYNHCLPALSAVVGPGHFLVVPSEQAQGEVWIDYRWRCDGVPAGFPPPRSNERFPDRLVWGGMVDVVRRVSRHVTIGRAMRRGRWTSSCFALCRLGPARPT